MKRINKNNLGVKKFSVLDLVPVAEGSSHLQSIAKSLELAQHVERLGYGRFWISEHHNMDTLVSSATPILIGHIAQGTQNIRVGSGGVMLPNHAPLIVAEQFGTLETLYSGRIDLGLGRAPGTDQLTAKALRRDRAETVHDFPRDIGELQTYFSAENKNAAVRAIPGEGLDIPLYLLGSSTFSAQLAGIKGLPYAFASHFAPTHLHEALQLYHQNFQPSKQCEAPYTIACVNVIAADTDEKAKHLETSLQQLALGIIRNTRKPLAPPVKSMDGLWHDLEKAQIQKMMYYSFVGSKETVQNELESFVEATRVDEIMVVSHIFDHEDRLRSYEILSEIFRELEH
ncbi:F420-dependent glucose-6-phosphate dehydrogenase [Arenibacter antarcticus]|uniref:LLM class flavin-dependent oxidoreductase n=1 Tax=Arenibacter antarcticus TaxID=2040469 RepID=A0ABW5V9T5_9FLAO|nr:LLM class flavin-dependent oxidoreductase [Arenibacter sp. H213]MCM4167769.1 LLM class flavin-dependent oxidoreductase [Arenibacter sp. H213]